MQPGHKPQFKATFAATAELYPMFDPTEGQPDAYWEALKDLPWEAVHHAFTEAPKYSEKYFPAAGQVRLLALPVAKKIDREGAQLKLERMLPAKADNALQDFYRKCDDVLTKTLGEKVEGDNEWILEGLLIALGRVYGVSRESMKGYRTESGRRRISVIPGPLQMWKRRSADPRAVVEGLRKVPAIFAQYPTPMMMEDVIRGFPTHGYPHEWLNETLAEKEARKAGQ